MAAYQALDILPPEAMFDCLYETLPSQLVAQRDAAIAAVSEEHGDG